MRSQNWRKIPENVAQLPNFTTYTKQAMENSTLKPEIKTNSSAVAERPRCRVLSVLAEI